MADLALQVSLVTDRWFLNSLDGYAWGKYSGSINPSRSEADMRSEGVKLFSSNAFVLVCRQACQPALYCGFPQCSPPGIKGS